MQHSEDNITIKLVDILETMRSTWEIEPQNTQTFLDNRKKPDFTVKEKGRSPVVVEVKIDDANGLDRSLQSPLRSMWMGIFRSIINTSTISHQRNKN